MRTFLSFFRQIQRGPALIEAIRAGDYGRVNDLLQQGAPVEYETTLIITFETGQNRFEKVRPLMWAAYLGHVAIARRLLEAGADVHARDKWQQTALMLAVFMTRADMINLLLERGAQVNDCDYAGRTVLMQAIRTNSPETVRILIEHGANLDDYTCNIGTALNLAYTLDKKEMIALLEKAGATMIDWDDLYRAPP